jgi:hypothetical protein
LTTAVTALPLAQWRDFYGMVGTASGVIVGATFVVATLTAGLENRALGLRGFITPIAVNLGSVLVGCAILDVPTLTPVTLAVVLGSGGVGGAIYSVMVATRIWHLKLDFADRSFYVALPFASYLAMASAAVMAPWAIDLTLEVLAVTLVALLVIGMRNAWDMATFMIARDRPDQDG